MLLWQQHIEKPKEGTIKTCKAILEHRTAKWPSSPFHVDAPGSSEVTDGDALTAFKCTFSLH